MIDPRLKEWAFPDQLAVIDAVIEHGSNNKAAAALGMNRWAVDRMMNAVRLQAQMHGYSPEHGYTRTVPEMFDAKRVSTLFDKEGNVRSQWVIGTANEQRRTLAQQAALEAMTETLPRLAPVPLSTLGTIKSLCNVYTLTDCHVGMLAWHREGGDDWDLKIAESTLLASFEAMIAASAPAAVAFINQLGDFLHYDSITPVTPTSGHLVDADGRFSKMVGAAIRILRRIIDMALAKHEKVVVLLAEGNHDISSSVWLRHMFLALYENEPRIEVIDSDNPYYAYQHGTTMLGFHHGHLKKNDQLPLLFAAQFARMWGETTKRYAHTGHRHHWDEKEHSGMLVTQHATMAAKDAYAARGGLLSERQVRVMTYHDKYGQVASNIITPEMLLEAA